MNIIKSFNGISVLFRENGYLNATVIAKNFNKQPRDYLVNQQTQEYILALAEHLSIKGNTLIDKNQLVIIKKGSSYNGGGTWLHPKLAVDFARWLDPKFAVWCDEQIEQILSGSLKVFHNPPRADFLLLVLNGWGMMWVPNKTHREIITLADVVFRCTSFP